MAGRKIKGHYIHTQKNERIQRNREIYDTWLAKKDRMSQQELGDEYGLSKGRINQILKRQEELVLAERAESR